VDSGRAGVSSAFHRTPDFFFSAEGLIKEWSERLATLPRRPSELNEIGRDKFILASLAAALLATLPGPFLARFVQLLATTLSRLLAVYGFGIERLPSPGDKLRLVRQLTLALHLELRNA
jgi:hypothetical protein